MSGISRRRLLGGTAALLAAPALARAQGADAIKLPAGVKPRVTVISQWSAGSDGAAITAFGKVFEEHGGTWQHNPVPGFTTEMMNKLRASILAGDPPAASQLKGPEIAAWSKIAPCVNLDQQVAAAGYEKVMPAELAALHKPYGHWIALPLQVYRTTTLFASKRAMDKVGATRLPVTWAEFNELAEKMKAAGILPVANGGIRWDDGMKFEIALAGISADAYRRALMKLDEGTLKGKEVLAAFRQLRKLSDWMDPGIAAQSYSVNVPRFIKGEFGMLMMGGWAEGVIAHSGFKTDDYMIGPAPHDTPNPCFVLNADAFIFWQRKEPDLQAGQQLMAQLVMDPKVQTMYSQITGSIPVRTDVDLTTPGWRPGQQETARALASGIKDNSVVLSLAHNMAQPNQVTAAMIDVLTEYVHNRSISAEEGQARLVDAVANAG